MPISFKITLFFILFLVLYLPRSLSFSVDFLFCNHIHLIIHYSRVIFQEFGSSSQYIHIAITIIVRRSWYWYQHWGTLFSFQKCPRKWPEIYWLRSYIPFKDDMVFFALWTPKIGQSVVATPFYCLLLQSSLDFILYKWHAAWMYPK